MCKSFSNPIVRRSSPALEQRAASILADFCHRYHFAYSKLNLREYKGHLHVDCHLHPKGMASLDTIKQLVEMLEQRIVFFLSESSGMMVDILCHIEISSHHTSTETHVTVGFPKHFLREQVPTEVEMN